MALKLARLLFIWVDNIWKVVLGFWNFVISGSRRDTAQVDWPAEAEFILVEFKIQNLLVKASFAYFQLYGSSSIMQ